MDSELQEVLDQLIEKKTFSLEGLEAIKTLKQNFNRLELELVERKKANDRLTDENRKLHEDIDAQKLKLKAWAEREKELKEREKTHHKMEIQKEVASASYHTLADMMNTLFKNTLMKETITRNTHKELGDKNYTIPMTETETTEKEIQ